MTESEAIGVIMTEKHCVERNIKHECDRDCVKCDLLMKDNDVLNGYDMAINALEEVQQYRVIGTPEECMAAVEKQIPKKPVEMKPTDKLLNGYFACPMCGGWVGMDEYSNEYCGCCGQKINWSDEE